MRENRLADAGDDNGAEVAYGRAIVLDASCESAWFNLGLVFKRRHDGRMPPLQPSRS